MSFNSQENQWPPTLRLLDFSSNCSLVADFFQSWFDINSTPLVSFIDDTVNATFWIPSSLSENATAAYFRNALPPHLRSDHSAGEILEWEYQSRLFFAETITAFNSSDNKTALKVPYFDVVINKPALACSNSTCTIGVDSDKLADLNGPGMHLFVIFQAVVLFVYSLIIILESYHVLRGHDPSACRRKRWPQAGSRLHAIYETVKDSFDEFSGTIGVFNIALPIAVFVQYALAKGLKLVFRKDFLLAGWIVASSLAASLWTWRIAACLRRIELRLEADAYSATHGSQKPRRRSKATLISGVLVCCSFPSILGGAIYIYKKFRRPQFRLEEYSDNICKFQYSLTDKNLLIVLGSLGVYVAVRHMILDLIRSYISHRERKEWERKHPHVSRKEMLSFKKNLTSLGRHNSKYRSSTNIFACVDLIMYAAGTITLLSFYEIYRSQLLEKLGKNWIKDGWNLGQVLSVSTILPIVIGFCRRLGENLKK